MNVGLKAWVWSGLFSAGLSMSAGVLVPTVRAEEPQPPPAPAPEDRVKSALEEEAAREGRLREEIRVQAASHLQAGQQLFQTFDYEGARRELEMAVQLDRSNEEAKRLLTRVNDILGVRKDRIRSAIAQLYGEHKIAVQEKLVELDNRIDWAKRFISEAQNEADLTPVERIRRMEQALSALERARELIKWMPVEVNVDQQNNEVNRLISETTRAIKAAQVRLEQVNREAAVELAKEQRSAAMKASERRLSTMVDNARSQYETGRYDEAIALAQKILEIDPTNAEANTIIAVARDRQHSKRQRWIQEEYDHQFKMNRERARSSTSRTATTWSIRKTGAKSRSARDRNSSAARKNPGSRKSAASWRAASRSNSRTRRWKTPSSS